MMACGLGFWLVALSGADTALTASLIVAALVATAVVPVVYSYVLWRRKIRAG